MKNWLRLRQYLHISPKFSNSTKTESKKSKAYILSYVRSVQKVQSHRFSPLLHYNILEHRFRRNKSKLLTSGKKGRSYSLKKRPIYYANHLDAQVYAFYAKKLTNKLQLEYKKDSVLNESVIGYRSIRYDKNRNKSTIEFATEVFSYVERSDSKKLSMLCLDVKSFFDSIDHSILKRSWYSLYNRKCLTKDEYNIYKSLTNCRFINFDKLLSTGLYPDIKSIKYSSQAKRKSLFYHFSEFRDFFKENKLVWKYNNNLRSGIPQGTPISAVLSNLYFLNVDKDICNYVSGIGGIYRRYSDDILVICDTEHYNKTKEYIEQKVDGDLNLEIQKEKTQVAHLTRTHSTDDWEMDVFYNDKKVNKPIGYLGFEYNGSVIKIRNSSLSKYYRGMKRMIRRSAFYAKVQKYNNLSTSKKKDEWIYRTSIFKYKSHLGARRKKVNGRVTWGNYISYIKSAARQIDGKSRKVINNQIKNHWKIIYAQILKFERVYGLPEPPISMKKERSKWRSKQDQE